MNESFNIYCVSNASDFKDNDLTCFKNLLPQNLDLKNNHWEIGIVKFGFQFNTEKLEDLSIVSIITDVVIDSPNGDEYSTLIYDTSLLSSAKEKYFNHYVKNIKYYPIRNTFIDTILTKFVDINGKKLIIEKGQPSFVHYHLRSKHTKDNYEMNYIRLDSENTPMEQSNTNSNFWVHLKDPMKLDENSEVALVNINFPNSLKNINSSLSKKPIEILLKNDSKFVSYKFNIPSTFYSSASTLIQTFNSNLPKEIEKLIKFSVKNDKFQIESLYDNKMICKFPVEFIHILGYDTKSPTILKIKNNYFYILFQEKEKKIATNIINVMYYYPTVMLCYANFVKHSIVGDTYFPILKIIPTETTSKDNYISMHFDHFEYIKINVEYLKDLHFELRDLNGNLIEFMDKRKVILNLVVKKA